MQAFLVFQVLSFLSVIFIMALINCTGQRIISMTHSVTSLPCPETWPRNSKGQAILA